LKRDVQTIIVVMDDCIIYPYDQIQIAPGWLVHHLISR